MKRIACIQLNNADGKSPIERCQRQVLECCGQFSPIVGFEPTDCQSVLLDITGLAHLFGGERAMAEAIVRDLVRLGFAVRAAVADTIGAAWAAAHQKVEEGRGKRDGGSKREAQNEEGVIPDSSLISHPTSPILCSSPFPLPPSPFILIPSGTTSAFLLPLLIESLRLPPETVRLLHELGLTCVGQLEALPREEFLSRFGPALLWRMDQAFGRLDEPVPTYPLPPKFEARWSAEYPTARRETIDAAFEWLIARVAAMLARCNRGALRLDCRLILDLCAKADSPIFADTKMGTVPNLPLSVGLFQPTADAKRLFELVQLQLERVRIASPVTAVYVAASLSAPLEPRKQATLFELDGDVRQPRRLAALVERLASRLGSNAVVGVRLRPEAQPELSWHYDPLVGRRRKLAGISHRTGQPGNRVPLLRGSSAGRTPLPGTACKQTVAHDGERLPSELPLRPLRLLPRPLPVAVTSIAPDGPPLRFQFGGREHTVARSWGPERIETGWWRGRPIGRDYFRIETAAGCRYWLFRRLRDGKWFLHGLFE